MESVNHSEAFNLMSGTPEWLDPLVTALAGIAGGGGLVAWVNRDKTRKEGNLAEAEARVHDMEAEALAVKTVKEALIEVKEISAGKDAQLLAIRNEARERDAEHRIEMQRQATEHARELSRMERRMSMIQGNQIRLASALAGHGQWDLYALAQLRKLDPDFPEPPPLSFMDLGIKEGDSEQPFTPEQTDLT